MDLNNAEDRCRLPEFKGQLIDILEDYCEAAGIIIDNPDKDEYATENNAAIIYGSDYDTIAAPIEEAINTFGWKMTHDQIERTISKIIHAFATVVMDHGRGDGDAFKKMTAIKWAGYMPRSKLREVFDAWKIPR